MIDRTIRVPISPQLFAMLLAAQLEDDCDLPGVGEFSGLPLEPVLHYLYSNDH